MLPPVTLAQLQQLLPPRQHDFALHHLWRLAEVLHEDEPAVSPLSLANTAVGPLLLQYWSPGSMQACREALPSMLSTEQQQNDRLLRSFSLLLAEPVMSQVLWPHQQQQMAAELHGLRADFAAAFPGFAPDAGRG